MNIKDELANLVLKLSKTKFELKRRRLKLVVQKQEINQKIYNLSKEMNAIEKEIDAALIEHGGFDAKN